MTESTSYAFTVKEGSNDEPFIMLEPRGNDLKVLSGGFLTFKLKPGTSVEEAQKIASDLAKAIETVSYTSQR